MCGRFYVDDETMQEVEKIARKIDRETAKAGDVHPSEAALVIKAQKEEVVSQVLKWGYQAAAKSGRVIFNARSESVTEKPMFKNDFESRRCIIPAAGFYEWRKTGTEKEKYRFFTKGMPLFLAGIYCRNPEGDRFTILTRQAEGCMEGIHDRMPVILTRGDIEKWLFSREEAESLMKKHFVQLERQKNDPDGYVQMSLFYDL